MERTEKAFGHVAFGPVTLDLGQIDKQRRVALAAREKQIGKTMASEFGRRRKRVGREAQHPCRAPLPVRVIVAAVDAGDTLVSRICAGPKRKVDLIAVGACPGLAPAQPMVRPEVKRLM